MTPLRRKAAINILLSHTTRAKKRFTKRKHVTTLTPAQKLARILRHTATYSAAYLKQFESGTDPNPLVIQCAAINTTSYLWAPAKAQHKARIQRIKSSHDRTKRQFSTPGSKTRVWVPRWPNENPAINTEIPEDKHGKSRESIVRAVQDQEDATKVVFEFMKRSVSYSRLPAVEKVGLMREHLEYALRLQGIEVIDWEIGCCGWQMEVFFQQPKSWKGEWGM